MFATHPRVIGDLDQIEALDRLCRQHGVRLRFRWSGQTRDPRAVPMSEPAGSPISAEIIPQLAAAAAQIAAAHEEPAPA